MPRKKGSKNKKKVAETPKTVEIEQEKPEIQDKKEPEVENVKIVEPEKQPEPEVKPEVNDNSGLEDRPFFSVDEAARFLGVSEMCARLWFNHGHLKGTEDLGFIRVSRASMLRVKVSKLMGGPNL